MLSPAQLLELISAHRYWAMFGILLISAMGLPIPEDVILVASGVGVGLEWTAFWPTCGVCLAGVVLGDFYVYCLGRYAGAWFASTRLGKWMVRPRLAEKVRAAFARHGKKTLFFGRLIPMVRFLVFFYSGQQGMSPGTFLLIDIPGAALQSPLTIYVGMWAARRLTSASEAQELATGMVQQGYNWVYAALGAAALAAVGWWLWRRRRLKKTSG